MIRLIVSERLPEPSVRPGRHQVRSNRQPIQKTRTCRDQVEAPCALGTDAVLHQAGSGRKQMMGVTVQTMIASSSFASTPRCANAHRAAAIAMSDVAISGISPGAIVVSLTRIRRAVLGLEYLPVILSSTVLTLSLWPSQFTSAQFT